MSPSRLLVAGLAALSVACSEDGSLPKKDSGALVTPDSGTWLHDIGATDGWEEDAQEIDAGFVVDAASEDAMPADASSADAAPLDARASDATPADASRADVGPPDGGTTQHDAGSGPWNPRLGPPPSKGLWIWYFDYTGYTATEVARRALWDGIGYVLIKSGQDGSFWTQRYNQAVVREFTSRGIAVFAWPYLTPDNIAGAIRTAVQSALVPGTAGVILDVEIEWEGTSARQYAQAATDLCNGIRQGAPGVFLGYTSFGWVGYHPTFPFAAFDQSCGDAFMPQVYWSDRGVGWEPGLDEAIDMLRASGLRAPSWLIQSNDASPSGTRPSTADLNAFFDRAGPYSSLWEFPEANHWPLVDQLRLLHFKN